MPKPTHPKSAAHLTDDARSIKSSGWTVYNGQVEEILRRLERRTKFDLVISSPPYNLGKEYEPKRTFNKYLRWQADIIEATAERLTDKGSLCWQVGNYVSNGSIEPLDMHLHSIFLGMGFKLRNRIVWNFGHGLHCQRRFSGRYEIVLWYTRTEDYVFNLDDVRVPSKYPLKRGRDGKVSSNPKGKNPEDFWLESDCWDIPNVKANHCEKTSHPCQFPIGLVMRLIKALSDPGQLVFDPFCGVGSTGAAAALCGRYFIGSEVETKYCTLAASRITAALGGTLPYRPHDKPIYDHTRSSLSARPHASAFNTQ